MKWTLLGFILGVFVSVPSYAQDGTMLGSEAGGGSVPRTHSLPAEFTCRFIYNQQIGNDYIKLVSSKKFTTIEGPEKITEVKLRDLKWKAEIDFEGVFKKHGNSAIIDGGLVSFRLFIPSYNTNAKKIFLLTSTPSVSPVGMQGDMIYSSHDSYVDMPGANGKVDSRAQFVFYQRAANSYVLGLEASCAVKSLK